MWYNMRVISELHHTPKGYETHCRRIVAECQQQRRDLSRQADPRRHPVLRQVRQLPTVPEVRRLSGLREFADCQGGSRADDANAELLSKTAIGRRPSRPYSDGWRPERRTIEEFHNPAIPQSLNPTFSKSHNATRLQSHN